MNNQNAIILFSKPIVPPQNESQGLLQELQSEELDALHIAVFEDVVEKISQFENTDIFVYDDGTILADVADNKWKQYVERRKIQGITFSQQVQYAVTQAVADGYLRIIVVIENHPVISIDMLKSVFHQLNNENDCIVLGPTYEGKYFLLGMKSDHSELFDSSEVDPILSPRVLLQRLCESSIDLLPTRSLYALDSLESLSRLNNELHFNQGIRLKNHKRTLSILRMIDKKYNLHHTAQ